MGLDDIAAHVGEFGAAHDEAGQDVVFLAGAVGLVMVMPFDRAHAAHVEENLLQFFLGDLHLLGLLDHFLDGVFRADLHRESDLRLLVGHDRGEAVVFGIVIIDLPEFAVGDLLAELQNDGALLLVLIVQAGGLHIDDVFKTHKSSPFWAYRCLGCILMYNHLP